MLPTKQWRENDDLINRILAKIGDGGFKVIMYELSMADLIDVSCPESRHLFLPDRVGFYNQSKFMKVGEIHYMRQPIQIVTLDDSFTSYASLLEAELGLKKS